MAVAITSCDETGSTKTETPADISQQLRTLASTEIIDAAEAPDFADLDTQNLFGFTLTQDTSRDVVLDFSNSVLHVPFTTNSTLSEDGAEGGIRIKIAKKYPKPGSGCSSCVDCIGFRCKPNTLQPHTVTMAKAESDIEARTHLPLSSDREVECIVIIRKDTRTADYYPLSNVDWQHLAANE